jgi:hypothetical protein
MRRGLTYRLLVMVGLAAILVTWVMGSYLFPTNHEIIRLTVMFVIVVAVIADLVVQAVRRRIAIRKKARSSLTP